MSTRLRHALDVGLFRTTSREWVITHHCYGRRRFLTLLSPGQYYPHHSMHGPEVIPDHWKRLLRPWLHCAVEAREQLLTESVTTATGLTLRSTEQRAQPLHTLELCCAHQFFMHDNMYKRNRIREWLIREMPHFRAATSISNDTGELQDLGDEGCEESLTLHCEEE